MFAFIVLRLKCSILFFPVNEGEPEVWNFGGGTRKGANFQR